MGVKAAGLPNIKGIIQMVSGGINSVNGPFYLTSSPLQQISAGLAGKDRTINFDSSRISPIYGKSDTLQPAALWLIPQTKY